MAGHVLAEEITQEPGQGDLATRSRRLGRADPNLALHLGNLLSDGQRAPQKVETGDLEGGPLASFEPRHGRGHQPADTSLESQPTTGRQARRESTGRRFDATGTPRNALPVSIRHVDARLPKVRQATCSARLMSGGSHHVVQVTGPPSVGGPSVAGSLPEALGCSS